MKQIDENHSQITDSEFYNSEPEQQIQFLLKMSKWQQMKIYELEKSIKATDKTMNFYYWFLVVMIAVVLTQHILIGH